MTTCYILEQYASADEAQLIVVKEKGGKTNVCSGGYDI